MYLEPFDHLLFFAAWPMLAACFALYLLRDDDTLCVFGGRGGGKLDTGYMMLDSGLPWLYWGLAFEACFRQKISH